MINKILKTYFKFPEAIFFYLGLYLCLYVISAINIPSYSALSDTIIFAFTNLLVMLVYALFISIFIGASKQMLNKKFSILSSLKYSRKILGNFFLLIIFSLVYFGFMLIAGKIGYFFINNNFLTANIALVIGIAVSALFLFISPFLIFSFFFHTLEQENILTSLKSSFLFAYKNYLKVLAICLIYFVLTYIISFIKINLLTDAIYFIIVYPLLTLLLSSIFINYKDQKNVSSK